MQAQHLISQCFREQAGSEAQTLLSAQLVSIEQRPALRKTSVTQESDLSIAAGPRRARKVKKLSKMMQAPVSRDRLCSGARCWAVIPIAALFMGLIRKKSALRAIPGLVSTHHSQFSLSAKHLLIG